MPIVVQHGGPAQIALAGMAGTAIGRAQGEQQQADDLKALLLNGVNNFTSNFIRSREIRQAQEERDRQREHDDQQRATEVEAANAREDRRLAYQRTRDSARDEIDREEQRQRGVYQTALIKEREAQNDVALQNAKTRRAQTYGSLMDKAGDNYRQAQKQHYELQQKQAEDEQTKKAQTILMQGVDSAFTNPVTGSVDETDPLYHIARAEVMRDGKLSKETMEALPISVRATGQTYRKMPASVQAFYPIAVSSPAMAVKLMKQSRDPLSPESGPSENAAMMQSAVSAAINDPAFVGPDGYAKFNDLVKKYAAAGAEPDLMGVLNSRLSEMKAIRQQSVYPQVIRQAQEEAMRSIAPSTAPVPSFDAAFATSLKNAALRAGVSQDEMREYLATLRTQARMRTTGAPTSTPQPSTASPRPSAGPRQTMAPE